MVFLSNMEKFTEILTNSHNNSNSNNSNSNNSHNKIKVYWFHTKTCPHCVKMVNSWNTLHNRYSSDPILNKKYDLVGIDVGVNSYPDIVKKYDKRIKKTHSSGGVPNIVMIMPNGKDYVYSGDRSASHLDYWIRLKSGKRIV